jgi:hypothetical protein
MINDCGWEWLSTRPGVSNLSPALFYFFDYLHEHVHTAHTEETRGQRLCQLAGSWTGYWLDRQRRRRPLGLRLLPLGRR